ncbi:MAG: hypothetical protein ACOCUR_02265 [Nanoarchaeota archaeon]
MDEELTDIFSNAVQELKRIDHIIFVTLKYTRTVDVLKSIIQRMIAAIDFILDLILEYYKLEGEIDSYQTSPGLKVDQIRNLTNDDKILEMLDFYLLLRKATRAEYETINEYKRHVGMVMTDMSGNELIINIDTVTEYYHTLKEYLEYVRNFVSSEEK